jgi:AcrR family transcriptional regulator
LDAAHGLFGEQEYFSTKVDDIAIRARVSSATIYAGSGVKQGLLNTLMDIWSSAAIVSSTLDRVEELDANLRTDAATCVRRSAASLAEGTARYRQALMAIARRLADLDALREGMDVEQAVDVLWFHFGYSGLFTLRDENGWSYERAERWLGAQANWVLLRNHPLC